MGNAQTHPVTASSVMAAMASEAEAPQNERADEHEAHDTPTLRAYLGGALDDALRLLNKTLRARVPSLAELEAGNHHSQHWWLANLERLPRDRRGRPRVQFLLIAEAAPALIRAKPDKKVQYAAGPRLLCPPRPRHDQQPRTTATDHSHSPLTAARDVPPRPPPLSTPRYSTPLTFHIFMRETTWAGLGNEPP